MTSRVSSIRARVRRELSHYPFGYTVLAAFLVLGPVAIRFLFPEATLGLSLAGGLLFGIYCAICAVPQKFL